MSEAAWVGLMVALITAVLGPLAVVWFGAKLRTENSSQHAEGRELQRQVLRHLEALDGRAQHMEVRQVRMEAKLDGVLAWEADSDLWRRSVEERLAG